MATSDRRVVRVELPAGMVLLNANDRLHRMVQAKRAKVIREAARVCARGHCGPFDRVRLRVTYRAPDNRRRDSNTGNLHPSIKAAIDGITDSGLIKDDNDKIVVGMEIRRGENLPKLGQLIIDVIEVVDGDRD